ncbi:hypothetical protein MPTA5024_19160 [Microbispora sp. ATCC PTA-5024]|nr:hypothetical protein MPTA5024_19160 [Microbispora sp. ATCC PTA-5024]
MPCGEHLSYESAGDGQGQKGHHGDDYDKSEMGPG